MIGKELYQLNTLVLCDIPEGKPDAIYIFAEPDTYLDLISDMVVQIAKHSKLKVALCGGVGEGYDFRHWHRQLREKGIKEEQIVLIAPDENLNMVNECSKLAAHARMFGWKNIWISAPPYQQPRAFLCLLAALKNEMLLIKVYNLITVALNWHKEIVHYNGEIKGRPIDFIAEELEQIQKQFQQGYLLSAEQGLKYLEERGLI